MLNLRYTDYPDFEQYEKNIGASGNFCYVDRIRFRFTIAGYHAQFLSAYYRLVDLVKVMSFGNILYENADSVRQVLVQYCAIPAKKFTIRRKGQETFSMDSKRIIAPLMSWIMGILDTPGAHDGYKKALRLLNAYTAFAKLKTKKQNGEAKLTKFESCNMLGWGGRPIDIVRYYYQRQSTGRYYTQKDAIQTWDLTMVDALTTPKDYILVWADFAQADYRICYHTILREVGSRYDQYYQECEDKYEGLVRAICDLCNVPFDKDAFLSDRSGFKTSILARIYGAGMQTISANFKDKTMAKYLDRYVRENKGHKLLYGAIQRALQFGIEIQVEDYFGVVQKIPISSYESDSDITNRTLNAPVQSATNSVIVHWTNSIIQDFRNLGYDSDKVRVYLIRHDESVFMVHKDAFKDLWVFEDNSHVQIDDWDLLEIELEMGYNYSIPDSRLQATYQGICSENKERLRPRCITEPRKQKYVPVRDIMSVYCITPGKVSTLMNLFCTTDEYAEIRQIRDNAKSEEELESTLHEMYKKGLIPEGSMLYYYFKYYQKYLIVSGDGNKCCMVEKQNLVIATAKKNKYSGVWLYNSNIEQSTVIEDIYVRYKVTAFGVIQKHLDMFINRKGDCNRWYHLNTE